MGGKRIKTYLQIKLRPPINSSVKRGAARRSKEKAEIKSFP
jgi:hypothetical protein